jgi:uncharacterized protein (DUF1697 family)
MAITRYIALLRGINVGGNKLVPMARLRALLESMGFTDVATLLQSGNAVFSAKQQDAAKLGQKIEKAIEGEFGFPVGVVIRTSAELAAALEANPLQVPADAGSRCLITFLCGPPDKSVLAALDPSTFLPDEFRTVGQQIYAHFPKGIGTSKLAAALGAARLGVTATARNLNTVTKLLALAER